MAKTSIKNVQQKARFLFLLLIALFVATITPSLAHFNSTGGLERNVWEPFKQLVKSQYGGPEEEKVIPKPGELLKEDEEKTGKSESRVNIEVNINDKKIQISTAPVRNQAPVVQKDCYRYTVTHLDGSTSDLCYSKADYDQLRSLGYQLSSAQTFYQFHLDAVQNYQDQYEITGSDIYLDAKESAQRSADREKEKMNQAIGKMQEIEQRGY